MLVFTDSDMLEEINEERLILYSEQQEKDRITKKQEFNMKMANA